MVLTPRVASRNCQNWANSPIAYQKVGELAQVKFIKVGQYFIMLSIVRNYVYSRAKFKQSNILGQFLRVSMYGKALKVNHIKDIANSIMIVDLHKILITRRGQHT